MSVKERILAISLWKKALNIPEYASQIGVAIEFDVLSNQTDQKEEMKWME